MHLVPLHHCCLSSPLRPVSAHWHECNCSEGSHGRSPSQRGLFSPGGPEVGLGPHAAHLAGQDAERHGAETPHRQVLGGAQGGDTETAGSHIRELRGGSCVTLAELCSAFVASVPHGSGHSDYHGMVIGQRMSKKWDSERLKWHVGAQVWLQKRGKGELFVMRKFGSFKYSEGLNNAVVLRQWIWLGLELLCSALRQRHYVLLLAWQPHNIQITNLKIRLFLYFIVAKPDSCNY